MTNSSVTGPYHRLFPPEQLGFSAGLETRTPGSLSSFTSSFEISDSQASSPLFASDDNLPCLYPASDGTAFDCGGIDGDFLNLPFSGPLAYISPSTSESRNLTGSSEIPWSEESGSIPHLSFDISYATPLGVPYDYGADTCPPSSSGSRFEFSSSFEVLPDSMHMSATSSMPFTVSPGNPYGTNLSGVPEIHSDRLLPSPTTNYPCSTWGLDEPLFPSEHPYSSSVSPPPSLFPSPGQLAHYVPAPETLEWASLPSENLFGHTDVFTSRCVQPGRLLGEPLRSDWSGKARKRSRPSSSCHTPSTPSTTDGSPIMVPHDPPQFLDSVVAKGPGGKFVCQHLPLGKSVPCGKSFDRGEHLKRHWATHTGERPFACTLCGRRFGRNDNLKQHRKTHDNVNGRNSKLLRAQKMHEQQCESANEVKPIIKKQRARF